MEKYTRRPAVLHASGDFAEGDFCLPHAATDEELARAHDRAYIERVSRGQLSEKELKAIGFPWSEGMVERSRRSAGATLGACRAALEDGVSANLAGGTHHAFRDRGEGFCVFNDFAWAALEFQKAGLRPVYIDWDVNAGDGVQNILEDSGIPTFSIHGHGIYPIHSDTWLRGQDEHSYLYMNAEKEYYNYALQPGEGDDGFAWAIDDIATRIADYKPDVILLATGADGHEGENWGLKYTYEGYRYASSVVADLANRFTNGRVLIGGAGGYQAETHTPRIWANVVSDIYNQTREAK
jgi:acetoin utilization deacetylase AcuC-like enzyme